MTFSEPMVVLGRIPQPVTAPFFKMSPAVRGTFRWSGTTILIFTPAKDDRLPYATHYEITIDSSAAAISGRKLAQPYTFQFTTPTVKLRSTAWYRKSGRFDSPVVIALRFNQPVRPADVVAHATLRFQQHDWSPPEQDAAEQARLNATRSASHPALRREGRRDAARRERDRVRHLPAGEDVGHEALPRLARSRRHRDDRDRAAGELGARRAR